MLSAGVIVGVLVALASGGGVGVLVKDGVMVMVGVVLSAVPSAVPSAEPSSAPSAAPIAAPSAPAASTAPVSAIAKKKRMIL